LSHQFSVRFIYTNDDTIFVAKALFHLAVYHCNETFIAFGIRKNMKIFWWKTVNIGHNTTQKTKKISNADPTKKSRKTSHNT
jgi:hypothetical protein